MHFFFTDVTRIEHAFPYLLMLIKNFVKEGNPRKFTFSQVYRKVEFETNKII